MQIFHNAIWSFTRDGAVPAQHDGSVVLCDTEPTTNQIKEQLTHHDCITTPSTVHYAHGAYDRQSGESLYCC